MKKVFAAFDGFVQPDCTSFSYCETFPDCSRISTENRN